MKAGRKKTTREHSFSSQNKPVLVSLLMLCTLLMALPAVGQNSKLSAQDLRGQIEGQSRPLPIHRVNSDRRMPDRYIVLFNAGIADPHAEAQDIAVHLGGKLHFTYSDAVQGFAATLTPDAVEKLRHDPRVALIEEDQMVQAAQLPLPQSPQSPAPSWALDRIDQRETLLDNSFSFPASAGEGVHIYVLDSGILGGVFGLAGAHVELDGRIGNGIDIQVPGGNANDCDGHGTLVASLAAGTTFGIAKLATVHPVRVLDCVLGGSSSGIIAGINWVIGEQQSHPGQKSVANMSLTVNGIDLALDQAVQNLINAGVVVSIAAGNSANKVDPITGADLGDSCNLSPQRVGAALTVGAMNNITQQIVGGVTFSGADIITAFSDTGGCVDLYAPGANMTGAAITSTTAITGFPFTGTGNNGTSFSAPLVAGVAAVFWNAHPTANASQVVSAITSNATQNTLIFPDVQNGPNRLLYSDFQTDIQAGVSSNQGAPAVGLLFTYTFQVHNNGPYNTMDSVLLTDTLPSGISVANSIAPGVSSITTTRGSCSGNTTITCDLGRLAVGDSAVIAITVLATAPGTYTNSGTAILQSGQTDRAPANNTASVTVTSK